MLQLWPYFVFFFPPFSVFLCISFRVGLLCSVDLSVSVCVSSFQVWYWKDVAPIGPKQVEPPLKALRGPPAHEKRAGLQPVSTAA